MGMAAKLTSTTGESLAWYAVYTRHQHEKVAACNLQRKGFEVFLPLYTAAHRWKDRTKRLSLPLFPCYVFLQGGPERRFDLLATPGVLALVENGGRAAAIPAEQIEAVRRAIAGWAPVEPVPYLQFGDCVRVTEGPLKNIEGVLVRAREGASKLILSVELLQRSVAVEVDASLVEPVRGLPDRTCLWYLQHTVSGNV